MMRIVRRLIRLDGGSEKTPLLVIAFGITFLMMGARRRSSNAAKPLLLTVGAALVVAGILGLLM